MRRTAPIRPKGKALLPDTRTAPLIVFDPISDGEIIPYLKRTPCIACGRKYGVADRSLRNGGHAMRHQHGGAVFGWAHYDCGL